ncbi:MAG: hypothetical protein ACYS5W_21600, partial [Planctomycetota bacterium]
MARIPRIYHGILRDHLARHRQMAFVAGPRQVGKTTTCRSVGKGVHYMDWDDQSDRRSILKGPKPVAASLGLDQLTD